MCVFKIDSGYIEFYDFTNKGQLKHTRCLLNLMDQAAFFRLKNCHLFCERLRVDQVIKEPALGS